MEYQPTRKTALVAMVLAFWLVTGLAATARADTLPIGGYSPGLWGPSAGARTCDAVNVDGICIAWHSTLKGINPARLLHCTSWTCDLRPGSRPPYSAALRDDSVAWQLSVVQHEITPLVLDARAKPKKAEAHQVRVDGPAGTRDDHGPIVPQVIEVHRVLP